MKSLMSVVGIEKADSMALASIAQGALVRTMRPSTTGPAPEMQQSSGAHARVLARRLLEEAAEGLDEGGLLLGPVVPVHEEGEGAALLADEGEVRVGAADVPREDDDVVGCSR